VGRKLRDNFSLLGQLESDEMGVPLAMVAGTLETAASYFEYYGGLAPSLEGENIPLGSEQFSFTTHEPYGVVGVITPWNAPLNQAARSIAPALAGGNVVVHKPSEYTSLTALVFAELAVEAGLPPGVWNVITGLGADVGMPLVEHPAVKKVAFTGSVPTGQRIGVAAAEKIMPVTLELGGKSPNIVFEDANIDEAIMGAMMGFVANSGQICLAGTRVLVQRSIYQEFSQKLAGALGFVPIGRELDPPSMGPIANSMQFEKVLNYFQVAEQDGAKLLAGGGPAEDKEQGYYIKPTLYGDVDMNMRIAQEEIFGPVGVLIPFDTEEEAIAIANDTDYGLAAGVWTRDISRVHRVTSQIEAGQIYVNTYFETGVESPLGGYKKSGIGREKGMIALKQYTHTKSVIIKL
jgi:aldehyde dehydrogenase (NAD+)